MKFRLGFYILERRFYYIWQLPKHKMLSHTAMLPMPMPPPPPPPPSSSSPSHHCRNFWLVWSLIYCSRGRSVYVCAVLVVKCKKISGTAYISHHITSYYKVLWIRSMYHDDVHCCCFSCCCFHYRISFHKVVKLLHPIESNEEEEERKNHGSKK